MGTLVPGELGHGCSAWAGLALGQCSQVVFPRLRGRGRRRVPEADEEAQEEEEEKEPVPQPPQSDDTRVENMDISDEGEEVPAS